MAGEIDILFMTKTAEHPSLWGRTFISNLYKGVLPRKFTPIIYGRRIKQSYFLAIICFKTDLLDSYQIFMRSWLKGICHSGLAFLSFINP